ncbi:MAG: hypothetical protein LBS75_08655 [Synergistaceae bacterium]|jgi:hypothetical protein|nr:hypothetical protein [Synergistaceae bacterium]
MNVVSITSPEFWGALLRAMAVLTWNVAAGLAVGELILSLGVVERVFEPVIPRLSRLGIHSRIAAAMLIALGSPRSGAALIAASYTDGDITREEATYGTMSLAFPGYLRRWAGTVAVAAGIAGMAGFIYSMVLIVRSAVRFIWVVTLLSRHGRGREVSSLAEGGLKAPGHGARRARLLKTMAVSLPWAWFFFSLTYVLVPFAERAFTDHIAEWGFYSFLPAQGWAVAVSALAHVTAALSSARGALAAGSLGVSQAVLALLVGSMVGSLTRAMRQNVGYWMGIFPREMIPGLVKRHLAMTLTLESLSIFIAWCVTEVV